MSITNNHINNYVLKINIFDRDEIRFNLKGSTNKLLAK